MITGVNIYKITNEKLLQLPQKYKFRIPCHETQITVKFLRKALALTKEIYKRGQIHKMFLEPSAEVFLMGISHLKAPRIIRLEHFYESPDNINFAPSKDEVLVKNTEQESSQTDGLTST